MGLLVEMIDHAISAAVKKFNGDKKAAAEFLGISFWTVRERLNLMRERPYSEIIYGDEQPTERANPTPSPSASFSSDTSDGGESCPGCGSPKCVLLSRAKGQ